MTEFVQTPLFQTPLFQTEAYFCKRLQTVGRRLRFQAATVEGWRIWQQELRACLHELSGCDHPPGLYVAGCGGPVGPRCL